MRRAAFGQHRLLGDALLDYCVWLILVEYIFDASRRNSRHGRPVQPVSRRQPGCADNHARMSSPLPAMSHLLTIIAKAFSGRRCTFRPLPINGSLVADGTKSCLAAYCVTSGLVDRLTDLTSEVQVRLGKFKRGILAAEKEAREADGRMEFWAEVVQNDVSESALSCLYMRVCRIYLSPADSSVPRRYHPSSPRRDPARLGPLAVSHAGCLHQPPGALLRPSLSRPTRALLASEKSLSGDDPWAGMCVAGDTRGCKREW